MCRSSSQLWFFVSSAVYLTILLQLLTDAMTATLANPPPFAPGSTLADAWSGGRGRFLIDGYPRAMDQALMFDANVSGRGRYLSDETCISCVPVMTCTSPRVVVHCIGCDVHSASSWPVRAGRWRSPLLTRHISLTRTSRSYSPSSSCS